MTISTIAGGTPMSQGGATYPCILYEGAITANAKVFGPDGFYDSGVTLAAPIYKNQWVEIDVVSDNVFTATEGKPVMKAMASAGASALIGKVMSEPLWSSSPPITSTGSWGADLARGAFRIATVWFPSLIAIEKATVDGASAANIVPGAVGTLNVDASLCTAAAAAGVPETLIIKDAAANGVGLVPLTYVANGATDFSILVGFNGVLPYVVA